MPIQSKFCLPPLLELVAAKGHMVFSYGDYDLNIIGLRTRERPHPFCDKLAVAYLVNDLWRVEWFACTTMPTEAYLKHPMNSKGCAILAEGQHRGAYRLGLHYGRPALVQTGAKVTVFRDSDLDDIPETDGNPLDTGFHGINIHDLRGNELYASAGCTVLRHEAGLDRLLFLAEKQVQVRGWHNFSYTLIEED